MRSGRFYVAIVCLCAPAAASAQPAPPRDPAAADALFRSALERLDAGDWDGACPKFSAAMELDPTVATLLNLAKCSEHEGKLARAWADYERALVLNRETTGEDRRAELDAYTKKAMADLEARLPRLRVVVVDPPPGLSISRDGEELAPATLGEALPADPGRREVIVRAPGYRERRETVVLEEGKTTELKIELEAESDPGPVGSVPPAVPPPPERPADPEPSRATEAEMSTVSLVGWILGGAGVAGLGVGAVTGFMTIGVQGELEERCPDPARCDEDGVDMAGRGSTLSTVSTVTFIAGAALTAGGITLILLGGDDAERAAIGVRPIGPGLVSSLEGRF